MPSKKNTKFSWHGPQGDFVKQQVKAMGWELPITKDQYEQIYNLKDAAPVLQFQALRRSWVNVQNNQKDHDKVKNSTGARKRNATTPGRKAKASDTSTTPGTSAPKSAPSKSAPSSSSLSGLLPVSPAKNLVWETLWSYWKDKEGNNRVQLFVVAPSGCRPKDLQISIATGGMRVQIVLTWPVYLFNPKRLFEGQAQKYGTGVANLGSTKASGLQEAEQKVKPTSNSALTTNLSIHLEQKVEENMVDVHGKATEKATFMKVEDEDWPQYPMLLMNIGLMINRAAGKGFVNKEEEEQVYE